MLGQVLSNAAFGEQVCKEVVSAGAYCGDSKYRGETLNIDWS